MRPTLALLILASVTLAGCTTTRVVTAPPVVYPHALFTCPDAPTQEVKTQEDLAKWIVDLGGAFHICKQKLSNVEELVNKPSPPVEVKK